LDEFHDKDENNELDKNSPNTAYQTLQIHGIHNTERFDHIHEIEHTNEP
jgi:hypothetical protein